MLLGAWRAAALLWGFAEATLFFVVPDILLSILAQRRGIRPAVAGACFAVAGACLGGMLMWFVGSNHPAAARTLVDAVPAISPAMIAEAARALRENPLAALAAGAFSGVPYKVFAAMAAGAGVSLPAFVAVSIPARALRFLLVILITAGVDRVAARFLSERSRRGLLYGVWAVFYVAFWSLMAN